MLCSLRCTLHARTDEGHLRYCSPCWAYRFTSSVIGLSFGSIRNTTVFASLSGRCAEMRDIWWGVYYLPCLYDLGTCPLDLESLLTFDCENELMTIRMDVQGQFESRLS
jgi:hypothetical protein